MFEYEDKIEIVLNEIEDSELIQLCNDIYNWKNGNGELDKNSQLYFRFQSIGYIFHNDIRFFESMLLQKAHEKYNKIVKLLFCESPFLYIKK